jgi:YVTN family beta-propeller protein
VCNYGSNNVTCINRSNNSKTTITTGANPYDIWGDSNYVYTCNYTGNNVTCIDRSNNKTTNITVGTNPYGIWGDSNNIYVNNVNSNNVTCITRPKYNPYIIRSLNGGNAYLGADGKSSLNDQFLGGFPSINEWDKYIVQSDLGGKITPGDDNIWHWSNLISWCQDTILTGMTRKFDGLTSIDSSMRMHRGLNSTTAIIDLTTPSYSHSVYVGNNVGLRPVLQYVEPGSKQTNLYY